MGKNYFSTHTGIHSDARRMCERGLAERVYMVYTHAPYARRVPLYVEFGRRGWRVNGGSEFLLRVRLGVKWARAAGHSLRHVTRMVRGACHT